MCVLKSLSPEIQLHKHKVSCLLRLIERVTDRKARGPETEEIGCKCQTFFLSLLSGRRKQTSNIYIYIPLLYANLKRGFS